MTKKITDASMAKAFGWKKAPKSICINGQTGMAWYLPNHEDKLDVDYLPPFTTDLNIITRAIEGEGLWWTMTRETAKGWALASVGEFLKRSKDQKAATPALALCAAYLNYKGRK